MRGDPGPLTVSPLVDTLDGFALLVLGLVFLAGFALVALWASGVLR